MAVTNQKVLDHEFLTGMYNDVHFPDRLVDKGKTILLSLCERIEAGSEIETVARDVIGEEFWFVATAYGFDGADSEELIATRDW
ncbi:DUF5713 family protein [Actinomadura verrucosospora]|uniref:Uncharacterized protein n=1 Tax=Actinomadura verrucosospora TaxID=46165 RepID=A0A7D3VQ46_ACTVE|nr:DUF5713 family protein [Actinomadura verrucosospora]QKG19958.1 hypothetical protein ACTIVE_1594 [Actinomadura verrucosospora]